MKTDVNEFINGGCDSSNNEDIIINKNFRIRKYLSASLRCRIAEDCRLYGKKITESEVLSKLIQKYLARDISI